MKERTIIETIKALFKRPFTIKYPYEPSPAPEGFRGKPEVDPEKCIGCGACARVCSAEGITIEDKGAERTISYFYGKCTFCARCEEVCPAEAVKLSREFELSDYDKSAFYVKVTVPLLTCRICGTPFVPKPQLEMGLEKVADLLKKYNIDIEKFRQIVEVCPNCRRKIENIEAGRKILMVMMK
ncbi:MAG: 4Fe-4S binding protein [Candidatus Baldrarchaeia archaeon]